MNNMKTITHEEVQKLLSLNSNCRSGDTSIIDAARPVFVRQIETHWEGIDAEKLRRIGGGSIDIQVF